MEMSHSRTESRATLVPGTVRRSSPTFRSGAAAMKSELTTLTAAGEFITLVRHPRHGVTTTTSGSPGEGVGRGDGGTVSGVDSCANVAHAIASMAQTARTDALMVGSLVGDRRVLWGTG